MTQLSEKPNILPQNLYNPSKSDFTWTFANDENIPIAYTLHAGEIEAFPTYIANHLAKHLADKLVMERGIKENYQADYEKMLATIIVNI